MSDSKHYGYKNYGAEPLKLFLVTVYRLQAAMVTVLLLHAALTLTLKWLNRGLKRQQSRLKMNEDLEHSFPAFLWYVAMAHEQ